ncbi:GTPase [Candidatus Methylocalor cossyra]|uniref:50S ribosome-binding GTPase n=1 Tax=Candidatus Methylocalor cossyra TaxID=3108543 RepID=A0ABP1CBT3_9GAMM
MQASFDQLHKAARQWAERAAATGWLPADQVRAFDTLEHRTPASLFEAGPHRPLVAAFFGGTGVGKSTLLNRLAGQPIARTGVERPTSREVSVYLHGSVQLRQLPKDFPLDEVRIAHHHDDARRQVLWLDMPDIDSVEQHNRELVLSWLPHVDVLIYVVSPERYRDDKGWRLLKTYGGDHAWLFVINQWDRGHPAQYQDFCQLLVKAGFPDPIVLRTDCREDPALRKEDDFDRLQEVLQEMADRHVIEQLETRAEALRREALRDALGGCLAKLGEPRGYQALQGDWAAIWKATRDDLLQGLAWPIQSVARAFVGHEANPLRRSIDLTRAGPPENPPGADTRSILWDEWAVGRLRDALDQLLVEAGDRGMPVAPLKGDLDRIFADSPRIVLGEGQRALRQALANPGNALQRILLKISGGLAMVLPVAAIALVSYAVVKAYYESALHHLDYLGVDFAVHSTLLIVLSWLLPYSVYRSLRPSAERTAHKGLTAGIQRALDRIGDEVSELLTASEQRRAEVVEEGKRLAELAAAPEPAAATGLLERVLPTPSAGRSRGRLFH